jgi:hypothetical protein
MTSGWTLELCPIAPQATTPLGFCEHCQQHVIDARSLTAPRFDALVRQARTRKLCVEARLSDNDDVPSRGGLLPTQPPPKPKPKPGKRKPLRGRLVPDPDDR